MKNFHLKQRLYAGGLHLLLSAVLVLMAYLLVFYVWYPDAFATASGVHQIVAILFAVDLVLGPLITFLIFKTNKKEFARDVLMVLVVQISALGYGLHTLHQGRPVWGAFVVDDIELVAPINIYQAHQQEFKPEYQYRWWQKPTLVSAVYSDDPAIAQEQKHQEMFDGISLATRPETYQPLSHRKTQILQKIKPLTELNAFNNADSVSGIIKAYPQAVGYLPVKGFEADITALVNQDGEVVDCVDLRPWE